MSKCPAKMHAYVSSLSTRAKTCRIMDGMKIPRHQIIQRVLRRPEREQQTHHHPHSPSHPLFLFPGAFRLPTTNEVFLTRRQYEWRHLCVFAIYFFAFLSLRLPPLPMTLNLYAVYGQDSWYPLFSVWPSHAYIEIWKVNDEGHQKDLTSSKVVFTKEG